MSQVKIAQKAIPDPCVHIYHLKEKKLNFHEVFLIFMKDSIQIQRDSFCRPQKLQVKMVSHVKIDLSLMIQSP